MKKKKKKIKAKNRLTNRIQPEKERQSPSFKDCDSYYFYNMGRLMDNDKKMVVEVGSGNNLFYHAFVEGLMAEHKSGMSFYRVDGSMDEEEKRTSFIDDLKTYNVFESIEVIPFSQIIGAANFDNKSIDIIFINNDPNVTDIYAILSAWYPKLKDNGWLSGFLFTDEGIVSNIQENELNGFAIDFGLGYSILQKPLTNNIFELYPKELALGLKTIQQNLNNGEIGDARQIAFRIMHAYPHSPFIANLKAELDYQCGMASDSKRLFEKIIDMWPYHVRAMNNLAAIEANTGNIKKAKSILDRVLAIDPNNFDAITNLKEIEGLNLF
ncbi:MAG TPA: hypothetical protein PK800_03395 [Syntrophorhabdaceae bacterium]|nr:hypothetical protein [Syntrophorhabdaceae bacterium]